jgi:hypothetical protein
LPFLFDGSKYRVPDHLLAELPTLTSHKSLNWRHFASELSKGKVLLNAALIKLETRLITKLNNSCREVMELMDPCYKLDIFKSVVKCPCAKVHNYDRAKELSKAQFSLRLKVIELLQHCHAGLDSIEQDHCKSAMGWLFPGNCNVTDVRSIAKNINQPSVTFVVERYLSTLSETPHDFDARLRKLLLYFLTDTSLLGLRELSNTDVLYDLQNSCISNRQKKDPKAALKSYIIDGMEFLIKSFSTGSYVNLHPFRIADVVDQFVAAFIGLTSKFGLGGRKPAYLPPSLVIKLGLCKITSGAAWSQKWPLALEFTAGRFLSLALKFFSSQSYEALTNWMYVKNRFNGAQISLFMTRLLKAVLVIYINRPADRKMIEKELFSEHFSSLANIWKIQVKLI